jgi:hypothetical protein
MVVLPDYASAYSALEAYDRPLATLGELIVFMRSAGEYVEPHRMYQAILDYQREGSVLCLHRWGFAPRYALRERLVFRRSFAPIPTSGPWAS